MLHTIFSAKFLAVIMAMALTASTVGIYAASISVATTKKVGATGEVNVQAPVSNLNIGWTLGTSGSNAGKVTDITLSWSGNTTSTIVAVVYSSSVDGSCSGTLNQQAVVSTSVTNATNATLSLSSAVKPEDVDCTNIAFSEN